MDDGSDDGGAMMRALDSLRTPNAGAVRIEILRHAVNRGAPAARNTGWNAATQPYIALLDADDVWHPWKLELQHAWMESTPSAAFSGHLSRKSDANGPLSEPSPQFCARRIGRGRLLVSNAFDTRSVMIRRSLPHRFNEGFRRSDDYLLWLSLVYGGHEAWLLEVPLASSFKDAYGEAGLSGDLWEMEKSELAVYGELARQGTISAFAHGLITLYSLAKHLKRVVSRSITTNRSRSSLPRA